MWLCAVAALLAVSSAAAPAAAARAEGAAKSEGGSKGAPRRGWRAPRRALPSPPCASPHAPPRFSALTQGVSLAAAYFTEISLPLEHALGADAAWTRAGTLNARASFSKSGAVRFSQLKVQRDAPSSADVAALSKLLAAGGLYRARLPAHALTPEAARHVVAFLPLRCLVDAGMAEHFGLSVDEAGRVYGLELAPPGGACAPDTGAPPKPPADWSLRTTVSVRLPKEAPPLGSTAALAVNASTLDAPVEQDAPAAAMTPPPPERSALAKVRVLLCALRLVAALTRACAYASTAHLPLSSSSRSCFAGWRPRSALLPRRRTEDGANAQLAACHKTPALYHSTPSHFFCGLNTGTAPGLPSRKGPSSRSMQ